MPERLSKAELDELDAYVRSYENENSPAWLNYKGTATDWEQKIKLLRRVVDELRKRRAPMPKSSSEVASDAELEELLDAPASAKEKAALDMLVSDPEEILKRVKAGMQKAEKPNRPPKR